MAFQCDDDIDITQDYLYDSGLLGTWEITDETVNGISDMNPKCCIFFEFSPDNNENDLVGIYAYSDELGNYYNDKFIVDPINQLILLDRDNGEQQSYEFTVDNSAEYLTFSFTENGLNFEQDWRKVY